MKIDQKGFSLVEALIIVVIVSVVGAVAYTVGHHSKKELVNSEPANNTTSQAKKNNSKVPVKASKELMEINDLGIQIKLDPLLSDLVYEADSSSDPITVKFASKSFSDLVAKCRNDSGTNINLGTANRYNGTFDADNPPNFFEEFVKQFDGYFITYGSADGGFCNNGDQPASAAVSSKYSDFRSNIIAALKAANPIGLVNGN